MNNQTRSLLFDLLQEALQVVHLEVKELLLLGSLFDVDGPLLLMPDLESLDARLKSNDQVFLSSPLVLQFDNLLLESLFAMLSEQLLSHGERHCTLIKSLVGRVGLLDVVADAQEKKTTHWFVESNLTDNLIKALLEQFLADGAEASLTGLPLEQLLVEHLTEARDIDTTGRLVADLLAEVLALLNPLSWRQDVVEDVFGADWLVLDRSQGSFSLQA